MQADLVLEKALRVFAFRLTGNRKYSKTLGGILSIYETSKTTSTVTHFLQQGNTYSNKTTPPNSDTPYELMGNSYIQTTTVGYNTKYDFPPVE